MNTPDPRRPALVAAWFVALAAMAGSILFSEVRGWMPCHLCWYQRICLWPLVPVLGVALARNRSIPVPPLLPQVLAGTLLAAYQVVIQEFLGREPLGLCSAGPDCAEKVDLGLGPLSIPLLSLAAFLLVGLLLGLHARSR